VTADAMLAEDDRSDGFVSIDRAASKRVDGDLVYAVGDIHGCYDLLERALARIVDDAAAQASDRTPVLVFCGDYVDRGADSDKVLATLCWLRGRSEFDVHLLMGNHERAMLDFIADPDAGRSWLGFGGDVTLQSYGVEAPGLSADGHAVTDARDRLLEAMPAAHLHLVQSLELMVTIGDYVFCHAGIRPGRALARQTADDLLWIRAPFLTSRRTHEKIVVHGHTWDGPDPALHDNRIGIDTGAYETGVLTCLRLTDDGAAIAQIA
jgi:serine/threonine protein phosphatase 1